MGTTGSCTGSDEEGSTRPMSYGDYLQLDKVLSGVLPQSAVQTGQIVHDEHLFIVIHQTYELWFKQIIFEVDSIRGLFLAELLDERHMFVILKRLRRINAIVKLLVQQFEILETMTPLDFMDFRDHLKASSGFQSLQFRILENKLGVINSNRSKPMGKDYREAIGLSPDEMKKVHKAVEEPSLLDLLQNWLARTPGLEEEGFDFWNKYKASVAKWLKSMTATAEMEEDESFREALLSEIGKKRTTFDSIFDVERHNQLLEKGERRFSHKALQGAIMIFLYKEEPRFSDPYRLFELLLDIDAGFVQWRFRHSTTVQRTIGAKVGSGGSSGYHYLRSTVSDRYKVFLDLFNLPSFLVPRQYIPLLNPSMRARLSTHFVSESDSAMYSQSDDSDELNSGKMRDLFGTSLDSQ